MQVAISSEQFAEVAITPIKYAALPPGRPFATAYQELRYVGGTGAASIDFLRFELYRGFDSAFSVDSTTDAVDAVPGDGVCATAATECTLRAAIMEANALPGPDAIVVPAGTYVLSIPGTDEDLSLIHI